MSRKTPEIGSFVTRVYEETAVVSRAIDDKRDFRREYHWHHHKQAGGAQHGVSLDSTDNFRVVTAHATGGGTDNTAKSLGKDAAQRVKGRGNAIHAMNYRNAAFMADAAAAFADALGIKARNVTDTHPCTGVSTSELSRAFASARVTWVPVTSPLSIGVPVTKDVPVLAFRVPLMLNIALVHANVVRDAVFTQGGYRRPVREMPFRVWNGPERLYTVTVDLPKSQRAETGRPLFGTEWEKNLRGVTRLAPIMPSNDGGDASAVREGETGYPLDTDSEWLHAPTGKLASRMVEVAVNRNRPSAEILMRACIKKAFLLRIPPMDAYHLFHAIDTASNLLQTAATPSPAAGITSNTLDAATTANLSSVPRVSVFNGSDSKARVDVAHYTVNWDVHAIHARALLTSIFEASAKSGHAITCFSMPRVFSAYPVRFENASSISCYLFHFYQYMHWNETLNAINRACRASGSATRRGKRSVKALLDEIPGDPETQLDSKQVDKNRDALERAATIARLNKITAAARETGENRLPLKAVADTVHAFWEKCFEGKGPTRRAFNKQDLAIASGFLASVRAVVRQFFYDCSSGESVEGHLADGWTQRPSVASQKRPMPVENEAKYMTRDTARMATSHMGPLYWYSRDTASGRAMVILYNGPLKFCFLFQRSPSDSAPLIGVASRLARELAPTVARPLSWKDPPLVKEKGASRNVDKFSLSDLKRAPTPSPYTQEEEGRPAAAQKRVYPVPDQQTDTLAPSTQVERDRRVCLAYMDLAAVVYRGVWKHCGSVFKGLEKMNSVLLGPRGSKDSTTNTSSKLGKLFDPQAFLDTAMSEHTRLAFAKSDEKIRDSVAQTIARLFSFKPGDIPDDADTNALGDAYRTLLDSAPSGELERRYSKQVVVDVARDVANSRRELLLAVTVHMYTGPRLTALRRAIQRNQAAGTTLNDLTGTDILGGVYPEEWNSFESSDERPLTLRGVDTFKQKSLDGLPLFGRRASLRRISLACNTFGRGRVIDRTISLLYRSLSEAVAALVNIHDICGDLSRLRFGFAERYEEVLPERKDGDLFYPDTLTFTSSWWTRKQQVDGPAYKKRTMREWYLRYTNQSALAKAKLLGGFWRLSHDPSRTNILPTRLGGFWHCDRGRTSLFPNGLYKFKGAEFLLNWDLMGLIISQREMERYMETISGGASNKNRTEVISASGTPYNWAVTHTLRARREFEQARQDLAQNDPLRGTRHGSVDTHVNSALHPFIMSTNRSRHVLSFLNAAILGDLLQTRVLPVISREAPPERVPVRFLSLLAADPPVPASSATHDTSSRDRGEYMCTVIDPGLGSATMGMLYNAFRVVEWSPGTKETPTDKGVDAAYLQNLDAMIRAAAVNGFTQGRFSFQVMDALTPSDLLRDQFVTSLSAKSLPERDGGIFDAPELLAAPQTMAVMHSSVILCHVRVLNMDELFLASDTSSPEFDSLGVAALGQTIYSLRQTPWLSITAGVSVELSRVLVVPLPRMARSMSTPLVARLQAYQTRAASKHASSSPAREMHVFSVLSPQLEVVFFLFNCSEETSASARASVTAEGAWKPAGMIIRDLNTLTTAHSRQWVNSTLNPGSVSTFARTREERSL